MTIALTDRDRAVLQTVRELRVCEVSSLAHLFPTTASMRQRLWQLARSGHLRAVRNGRVNVYGLGYAGAQALGIGAPPRVAPAAFATAVLYGQVRAALLREGYDVGGSRWVGRVEVLDAKRGGERVAAVALKARIDRREFVRIIDRLRSIVSPFNEEVDALLVFLHQPADGLLSGVSAAYRRRIQLRTLNGMAIGQERNSTHA